MYGRTQLFAKITVALDEKPTSSVAEVAGRLQVHRHTVTGIVRAETGASFRNWRDRRLFEHVRDLLHERGDLSIKEIRVMAGFNSTRAFDRFVKRHAGRCPTDLRRCS